MSAPRAPQEPSDVVDLEIVDDRTSTTRSDEGFLRVRRLVLRNVRRDGSRSATYPCDIVSRTRTDAVAIVLYERARGRERPARGPRGAEGRRSARPIFLRRHLALTQPDVAAYDAVAEIVAGMLEPEDAGPDGIARRAATRLPRRPGSTLSPRDVAAARRRVVPEPRDHRREGPLPRGPSRRSTRRARPEGDGSVMEEGTRVVVLPLRDAIVACRRGDIPDMKTEIALLRLCDAIGYLPALDRFVDELPPPTPGALFATLRAIDVRARP